MKYFDSPHDCCCDSCHDHEPSCPKPPHEHHKQFAQFSTPDRIRVPSNGNFTLQKNVIDGNSGDIKHTPGSSSIRLEGKAHYLVLYSTTVELLSFPVGTSDIRVGLELDNAPVVGSISRFEIPPPPANGLPIRANLSQNVIISVGHGAPEILHLVNLSSQEVDFSNTTIVIIKL